VYNERENLAPLLEEMAPNLRTIAHEIIAVDDGSTDGSLDELRALQRVYPALHVIGFRANAGQSAAVAAGFDAARGDVVVTLDADGQNNPADIPRLLQLLSARPNSAAVVGYRVRRADSRWKRIQSWLANSIRNWITRDAVRDTGCALKVIRRSAAAGLPRFDGMHRFLPTLLRAQGGDVLEVPVEHRARVFGRSKYGMWDRAWRGLVDAFGVRWFRRRALRYAIKEDGDAHATS
jgi:glycosyltransferase involved in cell wall biosynthesis